jgi:DNA processing protein
MDSHELAGWLRLALPGVGNEGARKLLAAFGLPAQVLAQSRDTLNGVVPPAVVRALLEPPDEFAPQLERTVEWLAASEDNAPRNIITLADSRYPPGLLQLADPPLLLYVTGEMRTPWPDGIAIVGSRNPTAQGLGNAREFAATFARSGITVVSGLALGIDGAAHEGALEGAAPDVLATIAVVGTGPDRVYPKQHRDLAHRIVTRGMIVSEYPIGTPPLERNFPRRNRIIAALTHGTVVVEAALQSGSLITAKQAGEQGKDVFAIPGSIHSPQSRGCHALIKQGAKLVETAQDVLEELPALSARALAPAKRKARTDRNEEADDPVLAALGFDPMSLDTLLARTGIATPLLQARLLELELAGRVARLAGGLFQRIAKA